MRILFVGSGRARTIIEVGLPCVGKSGRKTCKEVEEFSELAELVVEERLIPG